MNEPIERYRQAVFALLDRIVREERDSIRQVAGVLAGVLAQDHLIYVYGTGGHSYIAAEEMSWRAGGLAAVFPILDPGVSLAYGARRSTAVERVPGYARAVLANYPITPGDVLIISNAYGINACTIDAALWAKERGITTVAITSPAFSKAIPPDHPARHPSRRNLFELADYVLDSKMPERDAVLQFPGLEAWVSPVSTVLHAFLIQSLVAETVGALLDRGANPPVWTSANVPGGEEANRALIERYAPRIRWL
ncbi:MAG: SIS domain-containing protein [Armatimonadota bacterium]|nr:SIS domain-containing protein [Armatimonadota bacterium]